MESKPGTIPEPFNQQNAPSENRNLVVPQKPEITNNPNEVAGEAWQRQMAEAQEYFGPALALSCLSSMVINSNLEIVLANQALTVLLEYTAQELIGSKITAFAHPYAAEEWQALAKKLINGKIPAQEQTIWLIKKDGAVIYCKLVVIPFVGQQTAWGYISLEEVAEQIISTDKPKVHNSLSSENQEVAELSSFVVEVEAGRVHATPKLNRILGLPETEEYVSLDTFFGIIHPADRAAHKSLMADAVAQKTAYSAEYRILVNNQQKWLREKGEIRLDAPDSKMRVIGVIQDITVRKEKEEEFRQNQAMLLESQEIARMGSFQWDEAMTEAKWSPNLFRLYGVEPDSVKISREYILSIIHPEDREWFLAHVTPVMKNEKEYYSVEYRIILANNELKHLWARGRKVQGKLTGTVMDITERKELELKNARLAARNEELDHFVYTTAHDLRSPVNNIEMIVNFLKNEYKGQEEYIERYLDFLQKSVRHLKNTLRDLTTITEIHQEEQKGLVNLNELIEEIKSALHQEINEAAAQINLQLEIPFLEIPRRHARSLLFNLVSNALKFRAKDRPLIITITSGLQKDYFQLSVQDNGLGIGEADRAKIFKIFGRVHTNIPGRGVGMYLVKKIVDLNNGTIRVESEEGVGTTFLVQFPMLK